MANEPPEQAGRPAGGAGEATAGAITSESLDPWRGITPPDRLDRVSARRVGPASPWNVFWGVDTKRNCLLMLQLRRDAQVPQQLPRLRGLRVERRSADSDPDDLLILRLLEGEQRDIFHRLCLDIIDATAGAETEAKAVSRFLARTWRWHRLLRGGRDGRLSDEEQKGLFGELGLLEMHLFPVLGISGAVRSWTGPVGAPKDFEIGRICVEVKARSGARSPRVAISSEHQMDSRGIDGLFLHVVEIAEAMDGVADALTITEMAGRIRSSIGARDAITIDLFDARLFATGFDWADDYSDRRWIRGCEHFFNVRDGFPRITPWVLPAGVVNVRYSISLPDCEPFRADVDELTELIRSR